ncbi:MAG TPA: class I SAM-dependent methyltransferase [Chloroflexia bacterium]|nr:class I SAM-dependent methyltransferase [Chloroflexia bacterium]
MRLRAIARLLKLPYAWAHGLVLRDLQSLVRVHFLYAAASTGLLHALKKPASREELIRQLRVERPDLLESLLALGVSLGELSLKGGFYRVRGVRAKAFMERRNDPLVAMVEEYATYHSSVYQELGERLRGGPLGDYMAGRGNLIARSSRMLEPFIADFARALVAKRGAVRVLEVGCGSGIYMKHVAEANAQAKGIGIDMQPEVVSQAALNLRRWGIKGRFRVVLADIRQPTAELSGPFDIITLYNNIYYFPPEERPALFRSLRERLASGGRLAVVSAMRGASVTTNDFDLVLRSTLGCTALPDTEELRAQLLGSGFDHVAGTRLAPIESFYGLIATREAGA